MLAPVMKFQHLLLLFITVPLVELLLFIQLADVLSLPVTLAIILITGALGAYLARQQGGRALRNFQQALGSGKLPHVEATDGLLILIAGVVLLTPGFLTDAVGFALMLPAVRAGVRGKLAQRLKAHIITPQGMARTSTDPTHNTVEGTTTAPDDLKRARGRVVE